MRQRGGCARPCAWRRARGRRYRDSAACAAGLVLVRKIGVPFQPELAMGAMADAGKTIIVRNEDVIAPRASARRSSTSFATGSRERSNDGGTLLRRSRTSRGERARGDRGRRRDRHRSDDRAALRAVRARARKNLSSRFRSRRPKRSTPCRARPTRLFAWRLMRCSAIGYFLLGFSPGQRRGVIDILNAAEGLVNRR